jgi:molybdopterin-guanine dinucleotide biosynthesis protein A
VLGTGVAAAVVLAGGRSARMGADKAWLDWDGQPLLAHTCALLAGCVDGPVVVVRSSPDQSLPPLPDDVQVVDDPQPGQGPLLGMAVGLAVAGRVAEVAFVCATDLPLLHPAFVRCLVAALDDPGSDLVDVALPVVAGSWHPLAAAYHTRVADQAREAVRAGHRRVTDFVAARRHLLLDESRLLADPAVAAADPLLQSLVNVNDPGGLARARALRRG